MEKQNTCPICSVPLVDGKCNECGFYNEDSRTEQAYFDDIDRKKRQAHGDRGYAREDEKKPPIITLGSAEAEFNAGIKAVLIFLSVFIPPLALYFAVRLQTNGNPDTVRQFGGFIVKLSVVAIIAYFIMIFIL